MMDFGGVANIVARVSTFRGEAAQILGEVETSPTRVVSVEASLGLLKHLSLEQNELLRESLTCVSTGCFRSAVGSAWAAFMDALEQHYASDGFVKLHAQYPAWAAHRSVEDLRENVAEYALLEASRKLSVFSKGEVKILQGLLAKRNKCGHPSVYKPKFNDSLGFVTEVISWIEQLSQKRL